MAAREGSLGGRECDGGNIVIYASSLARHMHTTHVHRNIGHQTEGAVVKEVRARRVTSPALARKGEIHPPNAAF